MEMKIYGEEEGKTALLVHPLFADGKLVKELIASRLGKGWKFLIPDLSGHGDARDRGFTEIAKEADDIHTWLDQQEIRHLDAVWGASLGAAVAIALMRYVDGSFGRMVLDGCPMGGSPLMASILSKKMVQKHRKAGKDPERTVRKMTELYGEAGPAMADELIKMDERSITSIMKSCGSVVYPVLNEEQQKDTLFIYGEDDFNIRKGKSYIEENYPGSTLKVLPGMGHCAMLGKDPDAYAAIIREFFLG